MQSEPIERPGACSARHATRRLLRGVVGRAVAPLREGRQREEVGEKGGWWSPLPAGRRVEKQSNQRAEERCGGAGVGREPGASPMQGQPEWAAARAQPEGVRETRPFCSRAVSS